MLKGKRVVATDYLNDFDSAKANEVIAFAYNFSNYYLNTAYDMDLQTYVEQTTRNKVYQSYMLVDGKSVDSNGLVLVVKGATA
jgi:HK97 family phage major capsid protein